MAQSGSRLAPCWAILGHLGATWGRSQLYPPEDDGIHHWKYRFGTMHQTYTAKLCISKPWFEHVLKLMHPKQNHAFRIPSIKKNRPSYYHGAQWRKTVLNNNKTTVITVLALNSVIERLGLELYILKSMFGNNVLKLCAWTSWFGNLWLKSGIQMMGSWVPMDSYGFLWVPMGSHHFYLSHKSTHQQTKQIQNPPDRPIIINHDVHNTYRPHKKNLIFFVQTRLRLEKRAPPISKNQQESAICSNLLISRF